MKTYHFHANGIDLGSFAARSLAAAQEAFASDAGYRNWHSMVQQAEEYGGNTVEIIQTCSDRSCCYFGQPASVSCECSK